MEKFHAIYKRTIVLNICFILYNSIWNAPKFKSAEAKYFEFLAALIMEEDNRLIVAMFTFIYITQLFYYAEVF